MSGSRSPERASAEARDSTTHRPAAGIAALRKRAAMLGETRKFFAARGVMEVETPLLCTAGAVDEHVEPIPVPWPPATPDSAAGSGSDPQRFLVTSPELCMKRLLTAGSGSIYQITRSFRSGERGRLHNPEFTILEWYRESWNHRQLMEEVEDLIALLLDCRQFVPFRRTTYREAFERVLGLDPHRANRVALAARCVEEGLIESARAEEETRDRLLNLLLAARVEPELGKDRPEFLFDYPQSQAALARVRAGDPPVAERFELYLRGSELANGYHELTDAKEQEARFHGANLKRARAGRVELPIDRRFLAALAQGMPSSAGVAVGFDRLVMLAIGARTIDEVLAFPFERA